MTTVFSKEVYDFKFHEDECFLKLRQIFSRKKRILTSLIFDYLPLLENTVYWWTHSLGGRSDSRLGELCIW